MTKKAEALQRQARAQKAAKGRQLERRLALGPMPLALKWMLTAPELQKQRPGPTGLRKQEPASMRLENPQAQARGQKKLRERIAPKSISHRPRSPRAWAASGTKVPLKRQAFPAGGTSLRAWNPPGTKWVARKQDWQWQHSRPRGEG